MAKYSKKVMGKEVGPASTYADPHTMGGKAVRAQDVIKHSSAKQEMEQLAISVGNISKSPAPTAKTSGIKIRGTGAATKGTMARGPMA